MRQSSARRCHFNPRTPCGVRRAKRVVVPPTIFISIHAPRAGCDARLPEERWKDIISIHAPRAGCDTSRATSFARHRPYFNPRTPCGVRLALPRTQYCRPQFQSTHPVRGATTTRGFRRAVARFQSTHPVRGATPSRAPPVISFRIFQSTHPVRGATIYSRTRFGTRLFQSTHTVRGATANLTILTR